MSEEDEIRKRHEARQRQIDKLNEKAHDETLPPILDPAPYSSTERKDREEAEELSADLKRMNEAYALVKYGGKVEVMLRRPCIADVQKAGWDFISADSLQLLHGNEVAMDTVGTKTILMLGKWWLTHRYRRTYNSVVFDPDQKSGEIDTGKGLIFNTWEGLAIEEPEKGNWKKIRTHIYRVLCNSNHTKFKYVIRWFAWAVQNPGKRAEVALIFKGGKGAGKGCILNMFCDIFGAHGCYISSRKHLVGEFNKHLSTSCFLYADEAYHPGDKDAEGALKALITEPNMMMEAKRKDVIQAKNCLHIVMATNASWVVPITEDERRYFINEVSNERCIGGELESTREEYFDALFAEINGEGKSAMLHFLMNLNLKGWHPRYSVPRTDELRNQVILSLPKQKYAIHTMLEEGIFPGSMDDGRYVITLQNLIKFLEEQDRTLKLSPKGFKQFLTTIGVRDIRQHGKPRALVFPELGELRAEWGKKVISGQAWSLTERWSIQTMLGAEY